MWYSVLRLGKIISRWKACLCLFSGYIFRPHFLGLTESGPCFRPSGIKGNVRNDFRDFRTGDAVLLGSLQVISQ